jgi:HEAT repeat protein
MKDPSERVRQIAVTAAGKLKLDGVLETIIEFIVAPDNHHPLLQQAAFVAMADACSEDALSTLAVHHDPKVRRSGNLALRRQKSNQTARFINDDSSDIMIEAAQSIHDTPMQNALPQLARLHENRKVWIKKFESETEDTESLSAYAIEMLYYVYHANFILGKAEHLKTIMSAAGDQALPGSIRRMCLQWVRSWMSHKTSEDSPDETHNRSASKTVLKQAAEEWLTSSDTGQQEIMLGYLEAFGWNEFKPAVASLFRTFNAKPVTRASALKLLFHWEPEHIAPYLNEALISNSAFLRKEAVLIQAKMDPTDAVAHWTERLEFGEMKERQEALKELGSLLDRRVDAVLLHWLERALQDKLPSGLSQHLQQAAAQRTAPAVKRSLKQWQTANQISSEKQ